MFCVLVRNKRTVRHARARRDVRGVAADTRRPPTPDAG